MEEILARVPVHESSGLRKGICLLIIAQILQSCFHRMEA